jgi:hypothetical protein
MVASVGCHPSAQCGTNDASQGTGGMEETYSFSFILLRQARRQGRTADAEQRPGEHNAEKTHQSQPAPTLEARQPQTKQTTKGQQPRAEGQSQHA